MDKRNIAMRNPVLCRLSFENRSKRVLGARIGVSFMVSGQDLDSVMVV